MKLFVKNMVSIRCKMIVRSVLKDMGLHYIMVNLGEIEILENLSPPARGKLGAVLKGHGLELMEDATTNVIGRINIAIFEMVHYAEELPGKNSVYISQKVGLNYPDLAKLYSESTGCTIEKRIIQLKIERVKELLIYDKLTLTEISNKLYYSSVSHLSKQFTKVTGLTPTFFKEMKQKREHTADDVEIEIQPLRPTGS